MFRFTCLVATSLVLLAVSSAKAGIIQGEMSPDLAAGGVSAQYIYDGTGGGALRILGNMVPASGVVRGLYNPANPNGLYPNGNKTVEGLNVPLPMPSNISIPAGARGLFKLDAAFDTNGEFAGGTFLIEGAHSTSGMRVTLLKGTITEIDKTAFNTDGDLEILGKSTFRDSSMADFGPVGSAVGIKFDSQETFSSFAWVSNFTITSAAADIGRPLPEPASLVIFASIFTVGCCGVRRRAGKYRASVV